MMDLKHVSAQALSDTIGAIYDCALDPQRWQDALTRIVELLESDSGGMCVHHIREVQNDRLFAVGESLEFHELYDKKAHLSPFSAGAAVAKVGDVATLGMLCSDEELFESRFYHEVLKPYGYRDLISNLALRTNGRVAALSAYRTDHMPRYGGREINIFTLLSPHICRTLAISDALDIRTLTSKMLETTLDGLVAGVFLITRDGRVVYMNAAAERQIKTGKALRIVNNRFVATDPKVRDAFARAIDGVAREEADHIERGHALAIPEAEGTGYVATLLSLDRGSRRSIMAPFAAAVAVFVQESVSLALMPGEAFAKLYGLTAGELRVLLALAQGLGAKHSAEMLGIGEPTVRTHLKRIFSKTGTSRQAQLLQLLQSSTPPIRGRALCGDCPGILSS